MEKVTKSTRMRTRKKNPEEQLVGPQTVPSQPKFHFPAASKWTRTEMNLLRCRFDKDDFEFKWDELWHKGGAIPAELQQRNSKAFSHNLTFLGIDAGVKDLEAVKIKAILNEHVSEDLVGERVFYFRSTFRSLVSLAREKRDPTMSQNIPSPSTTIPTSNPQKRPSEATEFPPAKMAKVPSPHSPSISKSRPERLPASPKSPLSQTSAISETSVQLADEDYTRRLLMDFVMESRTCLGPRFYTIRWREIAARLDVGYSPLIIFQSNNHSAHEVRFRLNVDNVTAKNDGGINTTVKNGEWKDWRPKGHVKALPVLSFEVIPR